MSRLSACKAFLEEGIWADTGSGQDPWLSRLAGALRWIFALQRAIREDALDYRAMGLVYTTLLSLAPLLAVSFSVLKGFGVHNQLEPFLLQTLAPLGQQREEVVQRILGFVENIQVGVLGALGLALLFYSVVSLLGKIEDSLNLIWHVREQRPWRRRFTDYLSVVLIGPVLVFSALGITASMTSGRLVQWLVEQEPFGFLYFLLVQLVPYALIIGAFTFVYLFLPNTQVRLRAALVGAVCAGLAWKAVGWAFATVVVGSASYSAIYSGFATVILSMIWLYASWMILLLGAAIAFLAQFPSFRELRAADDGTIRYSRERLGLLLLVRIGRVFLQGEPPLRLESLSAVLNLPRERIAEVLSVLLRSGMIAQVQGEAPAYLPAKALDRLPLKDILNALGGGGESPGDLSLVEVDRLFESLQATRDQALAGLTLSDLVLGTTSDPPRAV